MSYKYWLALVIALIVAAPAVASAQQVPAEVPVQGFLTDDSGVPVDGDVTVKFAIYDAETSGTELYSEEQTISADAGAFTAYLTPDMSIFKDNTDIYLGLAVDGGAEMSPRIKMSTVPYAAVAGNAASLEGKSAADFAPSDYAPDWSSIQNVPADLADGDDDTTYTGSGAVVIDSNNGIGLMSSCSTGEVLKWDGSAWNCAADENSDTTYTASGAVTIDANNNIGLMSTCSSGEVLKWDGSAWNCASDKDTDTTYTGSGPVTIDANNAIGLTSTCSGGEVLKWIGGAWQCAGDKDNDTLYYPGAGLQLSPAGTFSVKPGGIDNSMVATNAGISASKLDFSGNTGTVTAGSYKYASPKTVTKSIPIYKFHVVDPNEDDPWNVSISHAYGWISDDPNGDGADLWLSAPVDLPEGAMPQSLSCYDYDNVTDITSPAYYNYFSWYYVSFKRQRLVDGAIIANDERLASGNASTSTYSPSPTLHSYTLGNIGGGAIDGDYQYWVAVHWSTRLSTTPEDMRFYGCKITYQMDGPAN